MMLDDFKIRDGKIHLTTLFRSHDFGGAYPANLYGLSRLLEYVARQGGNRTRNDHYYQHLSAYL